MPRRGENIYKRKDGRWEARSISFYDETGRAHYKSVYAKSYAEAKSKKKKISQPEHLPIRHAPTRKCSSFGEACYMWLNDIRQKVKESTYAKYRGMLDAYVIDSLGGCPMEHINVELLEQFFMGLLVHGKSDGTGLSAKSVSDVKSVVKMVLAYAQRQGWMDRCCIDHIVIRQEHRQIRVLEQKEQADLEKYLLTAPSNLHIGIYLSLYTGIRLGELCALRWEKIDLNERQLDIHKTMMRIRDYSVDSDRKTKVVETPPKSACAVRTIPIPDFLLCLLRDRSAGMTGQEYLLTGRADQYMEPRLVEYHFQKIVKRLGINNAHFHCLRHTFATRCVEAGFDVKTLSVILGHAAVQMTMNRYVHPTIDMKRTNMERLRQAAI